MGRISDLPILSLDLETGGLVPGKHTVLAIGAVVVPTGGGVDREKPFELTDDNFFYTQLEWDTVTVDPQAMRINRLNITNPPGPNGFLTNRSLPAMYGIKLFYEWLSKHYTTPIHALGVNVGSFDLQMLKSIPYIRPTEQWPFHYRSIDLNSLFFALSQVQNRTFETVKREITEMAWGKSEFSSDMVHNALADALSNVYVWEECLKQLGGVNQ